MNQAHPDGTPFDPTKYVDFMHRRWAPIGAENDKKGLNKNWAKNVRGYFKQNTTPEQYQQLQALNLVRNYFQNNEKYA